MSNCEIDRLLAYLHEQFPATVGHLALKEKLVERDTELRNQLAEAEKMLKIESDAALAFQNQLAEAQSKADDDWLNRIAIFWKGYTGKQWDVKDGEHREEGIASNLVVIFDEMHALEKERDQLKQKLIACEASRENKKGARNE